MSGEGEVVAGEPAASGGAPGPDRPRFDLATVDPRLPGMVAPVRRLAVPFGLLVLAVAAAYVMRYGAPRFGWVDFRSFYQAGLDVRAGRDPYLGAISFIHAYVPAGNGTYWTTVAYVYAPFFALLMVPLTFLSHYAALTTWDVLNVVLLVVAVYAALRAAGLRPGWGTLLLLAALSAVTLPVHREWDLGQTDVFLMALLCTALWARSAGRGLLGGLLLGAACAVKPELLLLALLLLWRRDFRFGLATVVSALVLGLAPFLLLGQRAWSNFWTAWGFWANQYVAFVHNESPKGVLARLFTINPAGHPLVVAPSAVTALWLVVAVVVVGLTVAVTSARPLRRDSLSLLEVGLAVEAIMLVSPLTERPYFLFLLVPLLGLFCWVREVGVTEPFARRAALAAVVGWVLLAGPAEFAEYLFDPGITTASHAAPLFDLLAPVYLWVTVAGFVLQLMVVTRVRGTRVMPAVADTVRGAPGLILDWLRDAAAALGAGRRRRSAAA
ncbi:MAG: glycosyltransferase family 87 protein [Candidatus Dormibacteria bacterium]